MGEVFLPGVVVLGAVAGLGADVVDDDLQVHLSLATETLDVGKEVTLVGADGTAQSVVVLKGGAETEWKDSGTVKAAGDHASVITGGRLGFKTGQASGVLIEVLRDDDGEIGCGKEEDLISEESGNPCEGHRTAVTG